MTTTTTSPATAAATAAVSGLLFVAVGLLLLLLCSSVSKRRKQRRQVESGHSGGGGECKGGDGGGGGGAVNGISELNRQWRNNHQKHLKQLKKQKSKEKETSVGVTFPAVTIVITPPSPIPGYRDSLPPTAADKDSIGSSGDLALASSGDDVKSEDVTRTDDAKAPLGEVDVSAPVATSQNGAGDVNTMTTQEAEDERGGEDGAGRGRPDGGFDSRPRLSSMEPGTARPDFYVTLAGDDTDKRV